MPLFFSDKGELTFIMLLAICTMLGRMESDAIEVSGIVNPVSAVETSRQRVDRLAVPA